MMNISPRFYQSIINVPSKICFIGAYQWLLGNMEIELAEDQLYVLSEAYSFDYKYIHNNTLTNSFLHNKDKPCIIGTEDIRDKIIRNWGISIQEKSFSSKESAKLFLNSRMNEYKTVVVYGDPFYLFYHPLYQKKHGSCLVIVMKYDCITEEYFILDRHVPTLPTTVYIGKINGRELINSLCGGEELTNTDNIAMIFCEKHDIKNSVSLSHAVLNVCKDMLFSDYHHGINGIEFWADELMKWDSYWNDNELRSVFEKSYLYLKNRGGPTVSRPLYFNYLVKNIDKNYCDYLNILATGISKKWISIAAKFFRLSISGSRKGDLYELSNSLRQVAMEEKLLFQFLYNCYVSEG